MERNRLKEERLYDLWIYEDQVKVSNNSLTIDSSL